MVEDAASRSSIADQTAAYIALDTYLGEQVAYVPLDISRFYFLYDSAVTSYLVDAASSMYPALGAIGAKTS